MDRNGTEAAAASIICEAAGGMPPIPKNIVILDRPFLYAIMHNETGLPLLEYEGLDKTVGVIATAVAIMEAKRQLDKAK